LHKSAGQIDQRSRIARAKLGSGFKPCFNLDPKKFAFGVTSPSARRSAKYRIPPESAVRGGDPERRLSPTQGHQDGLAGAAQADPQPPFVVGGEIGRP